MTCSRAALRLQSSTLAYKGSKELVVSASKGAAMPGVGGANTCPSNTGMAGWSPMLVMGIWEPEGRSVGSIVPPGSVLEDRFARALNDDAVGFRAGSWLPVLVACGAPEKDSVGEGGGSDMADK